jgi:hypothetical protein
MARETRPPASRWFRTVSCEPFPSPSSRSAPVQNTLECPATTMALTRSSAERRLKESTSSSTMISVKALSFPGRYKYHPGGTGRCIGHVRSANMLIRKRSVRSWKSVHCVSRAIDARDRVLRVNNCVEREVRADRWPLGFNNDPSSSAWHEYLPRGSAS